MACFVLRKELDVDVIINTIILWLYPTRGSPNNVCFVANGWHDCSTRNDKRSEFEISSREKASGKKRQVLYHIISDPWAGSTGHESGPPAGSGKFAKRRISGPDPWGSDPRVSRKQLATHGDPIRA